MVNSTHNEPIPNNDLKGFLKEEFTLSEEAIQLGIRHSRLESAPLSIVLRNFGLISLDQYQKMLDWIEYNN